MIKEENKVSNSIKQFSRFAHVYNSYNSIQSKVAKELIDDMPLSAYECIIDLGCGSGEVYKNIKSRNMSFKQFIAIDSSVEMLKFHPTEDNIIKLCIDFDDPIDTKNFFCKLKESTLVSSSSLQWSNDLDFTLQQLAQKSLKAYFAIFTSNTFKTLHRTANIKSPIYSEEVLKETIKRYYNAQFKIKEYRLEFKAVRDMFNYIKKSGVSGGEKLLSFRQTKQLMNEYPLEYLEFEVLFVKATSLKLK